MVIKDLMGKVNIFLEIHPFHLQFTFYFFEINYFSRLFFPGKGNGIPLQYSCLENSMDRGAGWATVLGITKSQTRLCD